MSEKILKALLQLFAIIAKVDGSTAASRSGASVARFLRQQFTPDQAAAHMAVFESFVMAFHSSGGASSQGRKRTSLNSVKVLKICAQVNEELTQRQKFIVLVHLLELIHSDGEVGEQEQEFVSTVAESFNIQHAEFQRCQAFVQAEAATAGQPRTCCTSMRRMKPQRRRRATSMPTDSRAKCVCCTYPAWPCI